jgi:hypothetical protein
MRRHALLDTIEMPIGKYTVHTSKECQYSYYCDIFRDFFANLGYFLGSVG